MHVSDRKNSFMIDPKLSKIGQGKCYYPRMKYSAYEEEELMC